MNYQRQNDYQHQNQDYQNFGYKRQRLDQTQQSFDPDIRKYEDEKLYGLGAKQLLDITKSMQIKYDESKVKQKVCIFWKRGQCKNGDNCTFLHADIEEKLPLCKYKEKQFCPNGDACHFRHIQPQDNQNTNASVQMGFMSDMCPYFDRGFCSKGSQCRFFQMHVWQTIQQQQLCPDYLAGFCPYGPNCKFKHLQCVIIDGDTSLKQIANFPDSENWVQNPQMGQQFQGKQMNSRQNHKPTICHNCGVYGHKSTFCQEERIEQLKLDEIMSNPKFGGNERVLCFNCSEHGHYANVCPKRKERMMESEAQNQDENFKKNFQQNPKITNPDHQSDLGKRNQVGLSETIQYCPLKRQMLMKQQICLKDLKNLPFGLKNTDVNQAIFEMAKRLQQEN